MNQPKPIAAFRDLILESKETHHLLDEKLKPTPDDIIRTICSVIEAPDSAGNATEILNQVKAVIEEYKHRDIAQEALDSLRKGEDEWDVLEILQMAKDDNDGTMWCKSISALGAGEEEFEIEILQIGPLYFIRTNEFDDFAWFGSQKDAVDFANEEFASFIKDLEDYNNGLFDEDEDEDEDAEPVNG
jgi:hypothetical protein